MNPKEAWERCRLGDWEMRGKSLGTSRVGGHGPDIKVWDKYLIMEGSIYHYAQEGVGKAPYYGRYSNIYHYTT